MQQTVWVEFSFEQRGDTYAHICMSSVCRLRLTSLAISGESGCLCLQPAFIKLPWPALYIEEVADTLPGREFFIAVPTPRRMRWHLLIQLWKPGRFQNETNLTHQTTIIETNKAECFRATKKNNKRLYKVDNRILGKKWHKKNVTEWNIRRWISQLD